MVSIMALLVGCLLTTYVSFSYLREGSNWVDHTQEVQSALGDLEADLNHAARAGMSYLIGGTDADLDDYRKVSFILRQPTPSEPIQSSPATSNSFSGMPLPLSR